MRKAFVMKLYEGCGEEYKLRHDRLWPEMKRMLKEYGVISYSIFLNEATNELFGYVELNNTEKWEEISNNEVNKEWWKYMEDIMETGAESRPVTIDLLEVFHLKS
ncbi:MAG TPA: L-rhamnose mutarotase [Erysipelothrix sp.]